MNDVRRADPAVRRQAARVLVVGTVLGALSILGFERYQPALRDWVSSEPNVAAERVRLVLLLLATLLTAPLLAFGGYLWVVAGRVLGSREFPPPGFRVLRDTPVTRGEAAVSRGRLLRVLALGCGFASVALCLLLWRLASVLCGRAISTRRP